MIRKMIIAENGINWTWYTHLEIVAEPVYNVSPGRCRILAHYRLHNTKSAQGAGKHPIDAIASAAYLDPWTESTDDKRTALRYRVPGGPTYMIVNPQNIFSYERN